MIARLYRWRVQVPQGQTAEKILPTVTKAAERVAQYNPNVEDVEVYADSDGTLSVTVHFTGRDQWWIKRMVVYAIGGVLAQSGIPVQGAQLVAIDRPEDRRSTRQRASDGRHNPLPDHVDIDHSDMGLVL